MKGNIMSVKKKYNDAKDRFLQLLQERPLETVAVISGAALAAAKLISSVTEARNAKTWKREVQRRERSQQGRYPR